MTHVFTATKNLPEQVPFRGYLTIRGYAVDSFEYLSISIRTRPIVNDIAGTQAPQTIRIFLGQIKKMKVGDHDDTQLTVDEPQILHDRVGRWWIQWMLQAHQPKSLLASEKEPEQYQHAADHPTARMHVCKPSVPTAQ